MGAKLSEININNIVRGADTFDIKISYNDGESKVYEFHLIKLGEFEYGHDNDIDTIHYPNTVKVDFTLVGNAVDGYPFPNPFGGYDRDDYIRAYHDFVNIFKYTNCDVLIKKNSNHHFHGFIDKENVTTDFKAKSFELTFIHDFVKLKDIDPADTIPTGITLNQQTYYTDMILKIVQLAVPQASEIEIYSDLRMTTSFTYLGETWIAEFHHSGALPNFYMGSNTIHDNYFSLLIDILNAFGMVFRFYGTKILLQSRSYHSDLPLQEPAANRFKDGLKLVGYTKEIKGLRINVRRGPSSKSTTPVDFGEVIEDENGNIENTDNVEEMTLTLTGGTTPYNSNLSQVNTWVYVPEYVAGMGNGQWITPLANEFYFKDDSGNKDALWKLIAQRTWSLIGRSRVVYEAILKGNNLVAVDFYKFETLHEYFFRPRKLVVDEDNQSTKIEFIEAGNDGSVPPWNSMSKLINPIKPMSGLLLYLNKTDETPINITMLTPLESGDGYYIDTNKLYLEFHSLYYDKPLLAEEFDGTEVTFESGDVYDDLTEYVACRYRADKDDELPIKLYPTIDIVEKGEWEEHVIVPETKDREKFRVPVRLIDGVACGFFVYARSKRTPKIKVLNSIEADI